MLMGPRPPSVQWPKAPAKGRKGKGKGAVPERRVAGARRWEAPRRRISPPTSTMAEGRRNPDDVKADHQTQIDKLERAVEILGEGNPEAAPLVALKKLRVQILSPVGERLDACQQFVERARKRFAAAQEAVEQALKTKSRLENEFEEGLQRLQRLREEAAAQTIPAPMDVPDGVQSHIQRNHSSEAEQEALTAPTASAIEVNRLRAAVDELMREREQLRSAVALHRAAQRFPVPTVVDSAEVVRNNSVSGGNRFNPPARPPEIPGLDCGASASEKRTTQAPGGALRTCLTLYTAHVVGVQCQVQPAKIVRTVSQTLKMMNHNRPSQGVRNPFSTGAPAGDWC